MNYLEHEIKKKEKIRSFLEEKKNRLAERILTETKIDAFSSEYIYHPGKNVAVILFTFWEGKITSVDLETFSKLIDIFRYESDITTTVRVISSTLIITSKISREAMKKLTGERKRKKK